jgi:hypothetical protein
MAETALDLELEYGWQFLRGTSQEFALSAPANHVLYHGTRGPGKTDVQLMRFRRLVGVGYGAYWRGIIFDREYKNLDDLLTKSKRWFNDFGDGAKFLESGKDFKWRWPTGEELLFRVAYKIDDYWSYHGHEYSFVGWNELTKYPDGRLYEKMQSINRSSFTPERDTPVDELGNYSTMDGKPLPPIPLETFSTCNPHGAGHTWVKRKFIDAAPDCVIIRTVTRVFNPQTKQEEDITIKQVAIHGHWSENPYLDPKYIAMLHQLTDENERKAWKDGDWNINAGGALADLWRNNVHVIPRFPVPENWRVFRSFDWGSSHPFSVGWWTEANGETVEYIDKHGEKQEITPTRGTLIRVFEWYGYKGELGSNTGLVMGAKDVAKGIRMREEALRNAGWIVGNVSAGPADNQIRNVNEADTETIEKKMADEGVTWTPSDKARGTRKIGLQLLRDRLEASLRIESAGILWMENCRASIALLPGLPRDEDDPDDVDTAAEDHIYDETRYVVLSAGDRTAKIIRVKFPQ